MKVIDLFDDLLEVINVNDVKKIGHENCAMAIKMAYEEDLNLGVLPLRGLKISRLNPSFDSISLILVRSYRKVPCLRITFFIYYDDECTERVGTYHLDMDENFLIFDEWLHFVKSS